MHEHSAIATKLYLHLTYRFHKWQRLDVTDCTANLDNGDIVAFATGKNLTFDFISDVRDDLYGTAQILTAALFV